MSFRNNVVTKLVSLTLACGISAQSLADTEQNQQFDEPEIVLTAEEEALLAAKIKAKDSYSYTVIGLGGLAVTVVVLAVGTLVRVVRGKKVAALDKPASHALLHA